MTQDFVIRPPCEGSGITVPCARGALPVCPVCKLPQDRYRDTYLNDPAKATVEVHEPPEVPVVNQEDAIELAFWRFDKLHKEGEVSHGARLIYTERDAFKRVARELLGGAGVLEAVRELAKLVPPRTAAELAVRTLLRRLGETP